ncbi:MAG: HAMP domain-containing histidine kinase [Dehalococcoidia bacterium]|jgi:signal transduction histidine kinase|nr:HAMP domain-containing histidine kinase [Dehalococcoidia bacterium]
MANKTQRYYRSLYEIAAAVNSVRIPEGVLDSMAKTVSEALEAKGCSIMLLSADRKVLLHTAAYGLSDWYVRKGPVSADKSISLALEGKPVAILNAAEDERVQYREQAKQEGIASMLSAPMLFKGDVVGVIRVYTAKQHYFTRSEMYFVQEVANLGTIALERARELEQCFIDVDKLEEGRRQFVRFLSIVAHDLQSPLVATQSILSYIADGYTGDITDGQKDLLQRGIRRIDELLMLITDLLDVPRIEAGQLVREMQEVSLNGVIKQAVVGLDNVARQKGIELRIELPENSPRVYASSRRLQQVLINLISNAINYTRDGMVIVRVKEHENEIAVEVTDTGIGVPPDELPKIFDDFFRGRKAGKKGTGLGLSISKRIVEAHGGKLWAESPCPETGVGSKFTFTVPKNGRLGRNPG